MRVVALSCWAMKQPLIDTSFAERGKCLKHHPIVLRDTMGIALLDHRARRCFSSKFTSRGKEVLTGFVKVDRERWMTSLIDEARHADDASSDATFTRVTCDKQ